MRKTLILICFLFFGLAYTQSSNDNYFNDAVDLYNQGDYQKAIERFLKILENGQHSESLYFNLGNSYYKLNDIANSIYYYEKALIINPNNENVLNNLSFSQNMLIDKIEELPVNQVTQFFNFISNLFSINGWLFTGILFLYFFLIVFIIYYKSSNSNTKKNYFILASIVIFLSFFSLLVGINKYEKNKNTIEAIIFADKIDFRSEPNYRSEVLFNLHAGTKVVVVEQLNDWVQVEIKDGNKGWIELQSIKKIK